MLGFSEEIYKDQRPPSGRAAKSCIPQRTATANYPQSLSRFAGRLTDGQKCRYCERSVNGDWGCSVVMIFGRHLKFASIFSDVIAMHSQLRRLLRIDLVVIRMSSNSYLLLITTEALGLTQTEVVKSSTWGMVCR